MDGIDINALIAELLNKAELLGSAGFQLALRQVETKTTVNIIIFVIAMILLVMSLFSGVRYHNKYWNKDYTSDLEDMRLAGTYVIWILVALIVLISGMNALYLYRNPEWYAIKLLIETFIK